MIDDFAAYVTAALFDAQGRAVFALGDGTVRFEDGARHAAHDGAILCACAHPTRGIITGGDDGRLVHAEADGAQPLAEVPGRWIEAVTASGESGLVAFAAGREAMVRDLKDASFARAFGRHFGRTPSHYRAFGMAA